eukprot:11498858-Karenia_brevis.AAC.1
MEHLQTTGAELKRLQLQQERCAGAGSLEDARKLRESVQKLSVMGPGLRGRVQGQGPGPGPRLRVQGQR